MRHQYLLVIAIFILATGAGLMVSHTQAAGELTAKEARELIARMAGIELPSDAVRVKEVSAMGNSAVVVAQVETAFRLVKGDHDKWRVAEIRTGNNRWEDVDMLVKSLNVQKTERARAELDSIATALESYRRERGFYIESKSEAALIDNLNPRYLARVIRVDPWSRPYAYEGTNTSFTLRSAGPDGKMNTGDDVVLTSGQAR